MIQMTLNLKSKHSSRVFANNGKSYKLKPGSNTLNLEYDDYVSLATALGIKPIEPEENQDKVEKPKVEDQPKEEVKAEPVEEVKESEDKVEDHKEEAVEESVATTEVNETPDTTDNTTVEESHPSEEPETVEETKPVVDYSTWSTTKLKAEYKAITGTTCKLKKDEIVAFLQERNSNV